ncbi:Amine oxidase [Penicillium verhagenii]|uniref:Amine oxidase n=1 Tax=Penicillium verhagenii TaxID=1562060 RepID=UPI0025451FD7|nr:Amine oxidase [Penicillium verhagenii]XP_057019096.1 Amine oxidase [Penicillium verhagenii]KAJ5918419.1 Amine oxidase [Penicillium verhagenii]KAJ5924889.1 Amine oxidase [Penicillium verhagenii]
MSSRPHVGIIGAGFAGLRCADLLIQNGAKVTILEARDRIGGRVYQDVLEGHTVDMGANWIHGQGENPIMTMARETQTVTWDPQGGNFLVSRDGKYVSEELGTKITEFVWKTIADAFTYSNERGESIRPEESLYDFFLMKLREASFSKEEEQMVLDTCKLWGAYVGEPIERQSLRFFRLEECIDGYNYFVAGTHKRILEQVAKKAQSHADIKLNHPVVKIEAPPRKHDTAINQHQVTVTTATGARFTFDDLVITCPLGWLKHNTEAFTPALPPRLTKAIESLSVGRLEKIFVKFPRAFWQTDPSNSSSNTSNPTDSTLPTNPTFTQFLDPSYAEHPPHLEWNQECLSMASFPSPCAHPTLLFYTYGPGGAEIVQSIALLDPASKEYKETLMKTLQPFYSKLPGYDASSPDCVPSTILATRWQADPYAGYGSYSNFQVGLEQGDRDIEALRAGAGAGPERGLWFAGEHTAPFVALGTTTGAYWSGERVAGQVCERRGLRCVGVSGGVDDSLPSGGAKL